MGLAAEAPGRIVPYKRTEYGFGPEATITAWWQDFPGGYRVEARIPSGQLATHLGIIVTNATLPDDEGTRSRSFIGRFPGPTRQEIADLAEVAASLVQADMRMLLTDADGWRIAQAGTLGTRDSGTGGSRVVQRIYDVLLEEGDEEAAPDAPDATAPGDDGGDAADASRDRDRAEPPLRRRNQCRGRGAGGAGALRGGGRRSPGPRTGAGHPAGGGPGRTALE